MTHALFPCQQQLQFILILILINKQLNLPVDLVIFLLCYVIRKPNQFREKKPHALLSQVINSLTMYDLAT